MDRGSLFQLSPAERAQRLRQVLTGPALGKLQQLLQGSPVEAETIFQLIDPGELAFALMLRRSKNWQRLQENLKAQGIDAPEALRDLIGDKLDAVFEIKAVQKAMSSVTGLPKHSTERPDFFNQVLGLSPHFSWTTEDDGMMPMVRVALRGDNGRVLLDTTMKAPMFAGFIDILLEALIQSCIQSASMFEAGVLTPDARDGLKDTFIRIREKMEIWEQLLRDMKIDTSAPEAASNAALEDLPPPPETHPKG